VTDILEADLDVRRLEEDLGRAVEGEVRFDAGTRALYATDASNFRMPPIGVVIPKTVDDVVATHEVCSSHGAPILPRGCGTSLSGETVNHAVVIDCSKYLHRVLDIDPEGRCIRVQPGAINDQVNEVARRHGLVFGPDPSTHAYCTIGGNIGNNSCGTHSLQARFEGDGSRTSDNVAGLEVLTYDGVRMRVGPTGDDELQRIVASGGRRGQIYRDLRGLAERYGEQIRSRFNPIPRRVSGYNLDELLPERGFNLAAALVGTEGTCVTVLEATLKLIPDPKARVLLVLGYPDIFSIGDHLMEILEHRPIGCEALDHQLFEDEEKLHLHPRELSQLPDGGAWVLVELGAQTREDAARKARRLVERLEKDSAPPVGMSIFDDPDEERKLWEVREAGLAATAFPPDGGDYWPGWEDSAVAPQHIGAYLRELRKLYDKFGYRGAFYGHIGDGCIHSRISFDLRTPDGIRRYRSFLEEAADLVVSFGGSLSGEHGDGQQRAELLPKMFGPELVQAFRAFKGIWDPRGKMNPGKVVDPLPLDGNLKLGAGYNPWRPPVKFAYRADGGDFAHATLRCVGVGKCRTPGGAGVMCPSFMALREEKHTTRGRARLLFEMLEGDVVRDGWRSSEVKESLDLCLACKGCTSDCPVHVDMPTYKAEFLHHHYKGRIRPRHAYAFGLIDQVARAASVAPRAVNTLAHAPGLAKALKLAAGMSQQREIPAFARVTLQDWFRRRGGRNLGGPAVVVWPDTFNNYFHSHVGMAAVEAIEHAGWNVLMPAGHVCCGRPLYDYGFLDLAERYLRHVLSVLRPAVRAGLPVVGIEPSCLATFREELPKLLPFDDDAKRLTAQALHFGEFFEKYGIDPPRLEGKALLWGHCHQRATGGVGPEQRLLEAVGLDVEVVSGGCCGLAGSWGFEAGHHDLSVRCGEQALLPAVRRAGKDRLIVAGGFSCKTQIEQAGLGRGALHLAEVLKLAREHGPSGVPGPLPERILMPATGAHGRRWTTAAALLTAAGAVSALSSRRLLSKGRTRGTR
jgi:FAD/FMN-containing dehydrogenase/Fe-S oxidoreductase